MQIQGRRAMDHLVATAQSNHLNAEVERRVAGMIREGS